MRFKNIFEKAVKAQEKIDQIRLKKLKEQANWKSSDEIFVGDNEPKKVAARIKEMKEAEEFNQARKNEWDKKGTHSQKKSEYIEEYDDDEKVAA